MIKPPVSRLVGWIKGHPLLFGLYLCILIGISLLIIWAVSPNSSPVWTGFGRYQNSNGGIEREKTLWDWMNLLIVPLALAVGAYLLNNAERNNEKLIARERIQESTFQDYLDRMTDLLLKHNLRTSQHNDDVRSIARSRTLTVLRTLDNARKGMVIRFLYESGLIFSQSIITLRGADISHVTLEKANLREANLGKSFLSASNLSSADLQEANLSHVSMEKALLIRTSLLSADMTLGNFNDSNFFRATLANANLDSAHLQRANLSSIHGIKANFRSAQLQNTVFINANLIEANFTRANLSNANLQNVNLTKAVLSGANLRNADLRGAILDDVDLSFADLTNAKIKPTQLLKAKSLSVTLLMDGKLNKGDKYANNPHGS